MMSLSYLESVLKGDLKLGIKALDKYGYRGTVMRDLSRSWLE